MLLKLETAEEAGRGKVEGENKKIKKKITTGTRKMETKKGTFLQLKKCQPQLL